MKLASTLILVLNLGASTASEKNLRLRGGGDEYARQLTLANTTDSPTVSPAPSTYEPTVNVTANNTAPTVSPAPTTSEPTSNETLSPAPTTSEPSTSPSQNPTVAPTSEPSTSPSQKPTVTPTVEQCSADVLVPIGYYDDYDWIELPECVQKAAALFGYNQVAWDKGNELCPSWCDEWWKDLTEEQKWAAWVFGYDEERWNSS